MVAIRPLRVLCLFFIALVCAQQVAVRQIYQFDPPPVFLENLVPRPNGLVLVTEYLLARLWSFDPTSNAPATLVQSFPDYSGGLTGITEIADNVYVFLAGNATSQPIPQGTFDLLKVDYTSGNTPIISKVTDIAEAYLPNGLVHLPPANAVLTSDSVQGVVFAIDLDTGASRVVIDDPLMKLCEPPLFELGINGIRYHERENALYWINTACGTLNKVGLNADGTAAGQGVVVGSTGIAMDDFAITEDGTAYIAGGTNNEVLKMEPDGSWVSIAGSLNSSLVAEPTSMQFGRSKEDLRKGTLYVTTAGGIGGPINGSVVVGGQLLALDLKAWHEWT